MAKKFGKFLLFTAAVYYYMRKKDAVELSPEDDDYDDFSEDLDEDTDSSRNYVPLTSDAEKDSFVPLNQVAQSAEKTESAAKEEQKADADVEEFFDEEDATEEEPPINDN